MTITSETIWITGASSGIGLALARQLATAGNRLIVSGRDNARLESSFADLDNCIPLAFDVTDRKGVAVARERLQEQVEYLDRVILNAGDCQYFDIEKPDWSMMEGVMAVNFLGLVNCLEAAFDLLKNAENPHIIGIGSQASLAPFPRAEAYGASKAAVGYFLDSLRLDIKQHNMDVTTILPGFVDTPLTRKNTFSMPWLMDVDVAAEKILKAVERRTRQYVFPKRLQWGLCFSQFFPGLWNSLMARESRSGRGSGK